MKRRRKTTKRAVPKTAPPTKISKYHLSLAGEYRVCSELLKRSVYATVTFGNMKGVDVVAVGQNRRAAIVEVKSSQQKNFVTGFYQKYKTEEIEHPTFWVLYSCGGKQDPPVDRFFVLTHEEMAEVQATTNKCEHLSYEQRAQRVKKGVDNVKIEHVVHYEDAWNKIVQYCSEELE